jgi:membrane protein YqaA with SNARE-associated domain
MAGKEIKKELRASLHPTTREADAGHNTFRHKIRDFTKASVQKLQRFVDRKWYPLLIALLAAADNLILVIPNDGILISSSMLAPRRWLQFAVFVAVGSTLGAIALAALVELHGLPWITEFHPGITESTAWSLTQSFFDQYGLIVVFIVAASPLIQQPAVVLAALANTNLTHLALTIFAGRLLKFLIMAYLASHAPRVLTRLWGVRAEMEDAGFSDA